MEKFSDKRKARGRGLDSLLPGRTSVAVKPALAVSGSQEIALDLIDPNPYQTRGRINEEALKELADSIRSSGVIQPVVLRPTPNGRFHLVAVERRWLSSERSGKATIPATVRQISNEQAMEITIIDNRPRQELNPIEPPRAF